MKGVVRLDMRGKRSPFNALTLDANAFVLDNMSRENYEVLMVDFNLDTPKNRGAEFRIRTKLFAPDRRRGCPG